MKKKFIYIFCFLLSTSQGFAQDSLSFNEKYISKNNITIELGGFGGFGSLNYEKDFLIKKKRYSTLNIGLSYANPLDAGAQNQITIPLSYSHFFGKNSNKFFLGIGTTVLIAINPSSPSLKQQIKQDALPYGGSGYIPPVDLLILPSIGYEFITKKAFFFRAYACIAMGRYNFMYYYAAPWGGVMFGFKLKNNSR